MFYEVVYVGVVDESRELICAYAVAEVMDVLGSVMCAVEPVVRYVVYGSTIGNFDVAGFVVSLLSGIVGVSNIMLITVKERTHEFGIRKALGAKPYSILTLIIAESITITTLFGYIGMIAGIAVTEYMNKVAGEQVMDIGVASATVFVNPTVDLHIAIQATLTLIVAGTLAGFFPARKAVMIRPIEALRG